MNKVLIIGRTTRDIELRYTTGENPLAVAHFTLAVDRERVMTQISSHALHGAKEQR